jgi:hypothetical protein
MLYYPLDIGNKLKYPGIIQIDIHDRAVWNEPGQLLESIFISHSDDIRIINTIEWSRDTLANIGSNLIPKSITDSAKNQLDSSNSKISNFVKAASNYYDKNSAAASFAAGTYLNKGPIVIFREVGLRMFEFTFLMTADSEKESNAIIEIVKTLRRYQHPSATTNTAGLVLNYPAEFALKYMWMGQLNSKLPKFKKCVCSGLDVDYVGGGTYSSHRDGSSTVTKLSIRFTEVEALNRQDIEQGY